MAQNITVKNEELLEEIRRLVSEQQSGLLSIVTDHKLSILIGLTDGNVTRLHCRSLKTEGVIEVIQNSQSFRLSFMPASGDNNSTLIITGEKFIDELESYHLPVESEEPTYQSKSLNTAQAAPKNESVHPELRQKLVEIASEYIGMAAEILVDEAYQLHQNKEDIIRFVRNGMLDEASALKFDKNVQKFL